MTFLLLFALILSSAFFSAAEIAFFSLSEVKIRHLVDAKRKNARLVLNLKKDSQRLLITILIGNNIVNILAASVATAVAIKWFGTLGIGVAVGLVTVLILIFGEIVPKSFAQRNNATIACAAAPLVWLFVILLKPLAWGLEKINLFFLKFFKASKHKMLLKEELAVLTRMGVEKGHLDYREHDMIEHVLEFNDVTVGEVMTPKYRAVLLNGEVSVEQIAYQLAHLAFSRYPVYEGSEDHVVGYVHINDIMKYLNSDHREVLLKNIVRQITVVSELRKIDSVFREMVSKGEHLFLVTKKEINDDKEILGVVTLEDVLEEIVGEIIDETDDVHQAKHGLSAKK